MCTPEASSSSHNLPNAPFWEDLVLRLRYISLILLARPKRFELLTPKFVVWCSGSGGYLAKAVRLPSYLGSSILLCPRAVSITRTAAPARRLSECHDPHSWSVVDESRKLVRACRMAELLKCLRFNLTNALAGHAEFFSDFFKGMIGCAADAETHAQDALLPRC